MKKYTLYLDESRTHEYNRINNKQMNHHFCMAGVIIADDDFTKIENDINSLKNIIWNDITDNQKIILHEMLITDAQKGRLDQTKYPEYNRFKKNKNIKKFYSNLKDIFVNNKLTIVGGSICENDLEKYYYINSTNKPDKYQICLQLLLENYCHFLCKNNGIGKIIYESREPVDDERLRNRFYNIKLMGSMYICKGTMEKHLLGMDFEPKKNNNSGLQIADFVPKSFAKDHAKFNQSSYNIHSTLKYYRYDGNLSAKDRFGIKYMP